MVFSFLELGPIIIMFKLTVTNFTALSNLVSYVLLIWGKLFKSHLMRNIYSIYQSKNTVYVKVIILTPEGCMLLLCGYIYPRGGVLAGQLCTDA